MRHYIAVIVAVAFWFTVAGTSSVAAQQVDSFERLQLLVKPGDTIEVIGDDGSSTKGKLESLSASTLRLTVKGKVRDYGQRDALEIKQKRSDPLSNGAIIGALWGAGFGAFAGFALTDCAHECNRAALGIAAMVVYGGMGAGIGVGIDAMFTHRQTIYRPAPQITLGGIRVAPVVANGRKGVALRFSF